MGQRLEDLLRSCIVHVRGDRSGTGVMVMPGIVITCAHVLRGRTEGAPISLAWNGQDVSARIATLFEDLDVAVLEVELERHPCAVLTEEDCQLNDFLHAYGFARQGKHTRGDSVTAYYEGWSDPQTGRSERSLLKLKTGQIEPGFSGAPLLNLRAGAVCGLIRTTRDRQSDLGGRAVPMRSILGRLPALAAWQAKSKTEREQWRRAATIRREAVSDNLTAGIGQIQPTYTTRVANFLTDYLGTPSEPEPFGGRTQELDQLDAWLADGNAEPYLLVAAPAGRGKSALLAQWCRILSERAAVAGEGEPATDAEYRVAFVPISARYRTNMASVTFGILAARLASIRGELLPRLLGNSADEWRGIVADLLSPSPDGHRVVVVVDALDEAADWSPGRDLFPTIPPPGLRVVVSARFTERRPTAREWLETLGWSRSGTARVLPLPPLRRAALQEVLLGMGVPLDQLANRAEVVNELFRLTEKGDPLLVSLYVKDLWHRREVAPRLSLAELREMKPGLGEYFKNWWLEQEQLWQGAKPFQKDATKAILNILACALGPLRRKDIISLARTYCHIDRLTFDDAIQPLERFVIDGEGEGFVFNHPRLAEHQYSLMLDAGEHIEWEGRFLAWGRQTVRELQAGVMMPANAAPYVVQYFGAHLERSAASWPKLLRLISDPWRSAWYQLDRSYSGFLTDVDRAWRSLDREAVAPKCRPELVQGQLLCAMAHASVVSIAERLPARLLAKTVAEGLRTEQQALSYAARIATPATRAAALVSLASVVAPERQPEVLGGALEAVAAVDNEAAAGRLLKEIASTSPPELVPPTVGAVARLSTEQIKATALAALLDRPDRLHIEAILDAVAAAIESDREKVRLITAAARAGPVTPFRAFATAVRSIKAEWRRFSPLSAAASWLRREDLGEWLPLLYWTDEALWEAYPGNERDSRLKEGDEALLGPLDETHARRVRLLQAAFSWLPYRLQLELVHEVRAIEHRPTRLAAVWAIAPGLDDAMAVAMLSLLEDDGRDSVVADTLSAVASRLRSARALSRAFRFALEELPPNDSVRALIILASRMGAAARALTLSRVRSVPSNRLRVVLLCHALRHWPSTERGRVFSHALRYASDSPRQADCFDALTLLARSAPPGLVGRCLQVVPPDRNSPAYHGLLAAVSRRSDTTDVSQVLREVGAIGDEGAQAAVLRAAVQNWPEHAAAFWDFARAMTEEGPRATVFRAVGPRLHPGEAQFRLRDAQGIGDRYYRAAVLLSLCSSLPSQDRKDAALLAVLALRRPAVELTLPAAPLSGMSRLTTLRDLAELLPADALREALPALERWHYDGDDAFELLQIIARRAPMDELPGILGIVSTRLSEDKAAELGRGIASRLDGASVGRWVRDGTLDVNSCVDLVLPLLGPIQAYEMVESMLLDPRSDTYAPDKERLSQLVIGVRGIRDQKAKARLLTLLAVKVPPCESIAADPIVEAAARLGSDALRMDVLEARASVLSKAQRTALWESSLSAAQVLADQRILIQALVRVPAFASGNTALAILSDALTLALETSTDTDRETQVSAVVAAMLEELSESQLDSVLGLYEALLPVELPAPAPQSDDVVIERLAKALTRLKAPLSLLKIVVQRRGPASAERVVRLAERASASQARPGLLEMVAPFLDDALAREALRIAASIPSERVRTRVSATIFEPVPSAPDAPRGIPESTKSERAARLRELLQQSLPENESEVTQTVRELLGLLQEEAPDPKAMAQLEQWGRQAPAERIEVILRLHLETPIANAPWRLRFVLGLADRLTGAARSKALKRAFEAGLNDNDIAGSVEFLRGLFKSVSQEERENLATTRALSDTFVVVALADLLPSSQVAGAVNGALQRLLGRGDLTAAEVALQLADILTRSPPHLTDKIREFIEQQFEHADSPVGLVQLIPRLMELDRELARDYWTRWLRSRGRGPRIRILSRLADVLRAAHLLAGGRATRQCAGAAIACTKWWP
jgi:trypsin-like peptidase